MISKVFIFCAALVLVKAGGIAYPAAYAPGPVVATAPAIGLGVAYSAAPAVSQVHYSSPLISYGGSYAAQAPAITSQSSNILRSFGNLGQVSTYTKSIETPFSSVQKADVRVSNPGLRFAEAPGFAYAGHAAAPGPLLAAAPSIGLGVAYSAAPAVSQVHYSSPLISYGGSYAAQAPAITSQSSNILRSFGNLGQVSTYTKSIETPFSSVQKADVRVSNPGLRYAEAPAFAYAAHAGPVVHAAPAALTYSAAPAVSHFTYSGNYGLHYGY